MAVGAVLRGGARGENLHVNLQVKLKQEQVRQTMVQRLRYAAQKLAMPGSFGRKQYMSPDGNIGTPSTPDIGGFYLYQYDPKWKDKLPWYDIYPLVFPFDYAGGFYGINVHYLPPNARTDLMLRLLELCRWSIIKS